MLGAFKKVFYPAEVVPAEAEPEDEKSPPKKVPAEENPHRIVPNTVAEHVPNTVAIVANTVAGPGVEVRVEKSGPTVNPEGEAFHWGPGLWPGLGPAQAGPRAA